MANLLDAVKGYITPELISQAAGMLGENESGISKAIGGLAPTILAGMLGKANDTSAMGNIFNMMSGVKPDILNNLGGLLGGGNLAHGDPKDMAGSLMGSLFGAKVPAILNALSSFAGLKSSSTSSLLGLVGPLVMGVLGKRIAGDGLNAAGLANLLLGQKGNIMGALPSGLGSIMGLADLGGVGGGTTPAATGNKWLLPLLLVAGTLAALLYFARSCNAEAPKVTAPEMPAIDSVAIKAAAMADAAKNAAAGFMKQLASGFELKGNANGIESQLLTFVEDAAKPVDKTTWFNFDRLTFDTGSAKIDMEKSTDQLTNMVEILKAFPAVKLKIGGYTDNTGNEAANMKLSQARAEAVVAYLTGQKIDKARLAAEGYGPQHPVAANDTEEGRAQNRRIAVRVTAK